MERHASRDDQFARIENLLPGRPGTVGRNSGQSSFRRCGDLEIPSGDAVARFAGTFWRMVHPPRVKVKRTCLSVRRSLLIGPRWPQAQPVQSLPQLRLVLLDAPGA